MMILISQLNHFFLEELQDGSDHRIKNIISSVSDAVQSTDDHTAQIRAAGFHLRDAGLVDHKAWGVYAITDAGKKALLEGIVIDADYLRLNTPADDKDDLVRRHDRFVRKFLAPFEFLKRDVPVYGCINQIC